jgi:hypothetical protein
MVGGATATKKLMIKVQALSITVCVAVTVMDHSSAQA